MAAEHVLAFDIYGTLLDTSSISRVLSDHLGLDDAKAAEISALWRRYQLEYTWRMNSMNIYEPFDEVTRRSLLHALKENSIDVSNEISGKIMDAYNVLPCFPDTVKALEKLRSMDNVRVAVFSNGTQSMVESALAAAHISGFASDIYVADAVRKYKPAVEIYHGLLAKVDLEANPERCWLVSGNPFDVTGALSVGMRAIWVDRKGAGWADHCLPPRRAQDAAHQGPDGSSTQTVGPTLIVRGLEEIAGRIQ